MSDIQEKNPPVAEAPEQEAPTIEVSQEPDPSAVPDKKVDLDLDGADFLNEEEEVEEEPEEEESQEETSSTEESTDEKAPKSKKKMFMIAGALLVLIIVASVAGWWFFMRTAPPPPPVVEPIVIKVPSVPEGPIPSSDFIVPFEPFWIPLPDGKGGEVFLICKFALVSKSEQLALEAENKVFLLRDAVYYYLINKPYHFLIDPSNVSLIKTDLASVFSGYLVSGKIDDMLFESYLGK